jgi:VanZ family protein
MTHLGNRKGTSAWPPFQFRIAAPLKSRFHQAVTKISFLFKYWLPVLAWMALIFTASADSKSYQHSSTIFEPLLHWLFPTMSPNQIHEVHHLFRKAGHLTEYALFSLLLWRAIHHSRKIKGRPPTAPAEASGSWRWDEAGLALAGVFAYAATDEFHQIFVPTRTPLVTDVLIDTSGGALSLLLLWRLGKIFKLW